tara:strand:- start:1465 stop:2985 length:1521 start_codon:yes stop_codon:yes gene_type:complete
MKILDCTLRDGGYYTDWDFNDDLVNNYLELAKHLPIDIIELGYRGNKAKKSYFGEYYFLTKTKLQNIKKKIGNRTKISIMIDLKDWKTPKELELNLKDCTSCVDIIRFAVNPRKLSKIKKYLEITKKLGFTVAVNLMYVHLTLEDEKIISNVIKLKKYFDILYLVDSYGTLIPGNVGKILEKIKFIDKNLKIGFHSHNNLELALSNSIEAINHKVDFVDCTFTGMGRGAGNLRTELLLSYLGIKLNKIKIKNFSNIGYVVDKFEEIRNEEKWGATLPYMISGSTNSPQSEAMQLIKSKRYNMTDIVTYLFKKKEKKINIIKNLNLKKKDVLIVGGGISVKKKINYLQEFLKENKNIFVIFSSSRNVKLFKNLSARSAICITGNEILKIDKNFLNKNKFIINNFIDDKTLLPKKIKNFYKLKKNILSKKINNSPLAISLAAAKEINAKKIFLIGFDGFSKTDKINNYSLFNENQKIINFYDKKLSMIFLSETSYDVKNRNSIFKYLK